MDKIIEKDPAGLHLHKIFRNRHDALPEDDAAYLSLCDDIRSNGILEAIKITSANEIVDGRHRWRAARRMQLTSVPTIVVPEDEVESIMLRSLLHRRHYTASQLAYAVVDGGLLDNAFSAARRRQLAGRKTTSTAKTVEDWARELSLSTEPLRQARKLRELFEAHPETLTWNDERDPKTLRDYYEPRIMARNDSVGLGAAIAGIAGKLDALASAAKGGHPGGKPTLPSRQLDLFKSTFTTLNTRWEYWASFDTGQKDEIRRTVRTTIEGAPDDFLKSMERDLALELKRRKEVA